ncbi:MAG TPA: ATP-binding protein [Parafilimonas sp.]|nr:ATP-binding protein [Parafilimonas sp.]
MPLELIIIIIIVGYLRKQLKTATTMPVWNKRLLWLLYVAIALIVVNFLARVSDVAVQWLAIILLSLLMYIIYENEKFSIAKFFLTAVIPYLVASFITQVVRLISMHFYTQWHNWFDTSKTFAIIWGIGTWIVTRKQQKELIKAREKAREEHENNKIITAMKAELELQVIERTAELTKQKEELETTLHELKSAQAQLVQSEKMASLGELTAGIAHEIQNPLNFVNNFSEVNDELISELVEEVEKGNKEEAKLIADNIKQNLEKINHHGKRADAIVKGMLQHSRKNTGQKEPTDINALCDEYLRLSYHGLRAKDKSFNADFKTDFDESLSAGKAGTGKINIIPQDIGRALLNLFNNAFYAVNEKKKNLSDIKDLTVSERYHPIVSVQTKKINGAIEITVKDNGNGIPQNIIDKIFQPFFTTKPTGEGTGLGLSLAYDIITKEHNGTIRAESKEGEGTTFTITIPLA